MGKIMKNGIEYSASSNSAVNISYDGTKNVKEAIDEVNSSLTASDNLKFRFATDGEGTYGFLGADGSLIPFKNSIAISDLQYNYGYSISRSITPNKNGIVIGYIGGYNVESYTTTFTITGATNVQRISSGRVGGATIFFFIGECEAGKAVSMSVDNNGSWSGCNSVMICF